MRLAKKGKDLMSL